MWTAPPASGPVVFHASANAANKDEFARGDYVYTGHGPIAGRERERSDHHSNRQGTLALRSAPPTNRLSGDRLFSWHWYSNSSAPLVNPSV